MLQGIGYTVARGYGRLDTVVLTSPDGDGFNILIRSFNTFVRKESCEGKLHFIIAKFSNVVPPEIVFQATVGIHLNEKFVTRKKS